MVVLENEYLAAVAPLAVALCSIPTVDEAMTGMMRWPRPLMLTSQELSNLALSEASLRDGRWWTGISYVFVHQGVDHLWSNLGTILLAGSAVFRNVGVPGLYGVFLVSGVVAGANHWGRARQIEAQMTQSIPRVPEHVGPIPVPELARDLWDAVRHDTVSLTAPVISRRTQYIGASGAACGLMGYACVSTLQRLWRYFTADEEMSTSAVSELLSIALGLAQCGNFLVSECRKVNGEEGMTRVDHSGHLTGFVVGTLTAFGVLLFRTRSARTVREPRATGRCKSDRPFR